MNKTWTGEGWHLKDSQQKGEYKQAWWKDGVSGRIMDKIRMKRFTGHSVGSLRKSGGHQSQLRSSSLTFFCHFLSN